MKTKIILLTSFIFLLTSYVFSQDGTLDTSFDTDGKVITDFSQGNNYAEIQILPLTVVKPSTSATFS